MKKIENGNAKVIDGIRKLADVVGSTLGPGGRTVLLENRFGTEPYVTSDGVTVAKFIEFEDKFEDLGASLIRAAAVNALKKAGDGTTTATVLAHKLIERGLEERVGANIVYPKFTKGMKDAAADVKYWLVKQSKDATDDIQYVATISAGGDKVMGGLVAEAFAAVDNGTVKIKPVSLGEDHLELTDGLEFENGVVSHFMMLPNQRKETFKDARILVTDIDITSVHDFGHQGRGILYDCINTDTPLVIFANRVSEAFVRTISKLRLESNVKIVAVLNPAFGDDRRELMEDIAAMSGGRVLFEKTGKKLTDASEFAGKVSEVTFSADNTTITTKDGGINEVLAKHLAKLGEILESDGKDIDKGFLQERISKLNKGVALVCVTGNTEAEQREKIDRLDDAIRAVYSALDSGVVPGGGVMLFKAARAARRDTSGETASYKLGYDLLFNTLHAPLERILSNFGYTDETKSLYDRLNESDVWDTYDIDTLELRNALELGLIDPVAVIVNALDGAVSVASTVLSVSHSVVWADMGNDLTL